MPEWGDAAHRCTSLSTKTELNVEQQSSSLPVAGHALAQLGDRMQQAPHIYLEAASSFVPDASTGSHKKASPKADGAPCEMVHIIRSLSQAEG